MTTYGSREVTCSACGTSSVQAIIGSTSSLGSPDLDLRPPELKRSSMAFWLQECSSCGFVATDLTRPEKGVQALLVKEGYQALLQGKFGGTLIGRCLQRSFLDESLGRLAEAAEHALWAAWAADDKGDPAATEFRSKSADLFIAAAGKMPPNSGTSTTMLTRAIDVLRRAERWDEALTVADKMLASDTIDTTVRSVVEFSRGLAIARDASAHTVHDALSASSEDEMAG